MTEQYAEIVKLYEAGNSMCTIAKQFNITRQRVHQILKPRTQSRSIKEAYSLKESVGRTTVELHKLGFNIVEISEKMGVSTATTIWRLRSRGIKYDYFQPMRDEKLAQIVCMYIDGDSIEAIAKAFEVQPSAIRNFVSAQGIRLVKAKKAMYELAN